MHHVTVYKPLTSSFVCGRKEEKQAMRNCGKNLNQDKKRNQKWTCKNKPNIDTETTDGQGYEEESYGASALCTEMGSSTTVVTEGKEEKTWRNFQNSSNLLVNESNSYARRS